ncbi:MAG TPA: CDP-archaeol synthase [Thermodesulfobacteriota bacterium]|nr:CDP-archaeol synthase [Candidatus Paceibacterota bacterium]HVY55887.1 CDP-archaeol synthase [Thermodesulfobacteriota bacterium]
MDTLFKEAETLIILAGAVNIALNILGALKRRFGLERFDAPFDFRIAIGGRRLLGASTTWIGFILCALSGALMSVWGIAYGYVIAFGVFFGHALGSFIKRRMGVADGGPLPLVDRANFVVLSGAALLFMGSMRPVAYVAAVILAYFIHPVFCKLGVMLGIRVVQ